MRDRCASGVLLDTSGPAATHGRRQLLGVQHQAEQINAGPRPGVELRALPWPGRIICSPAAGHPAFLAQAGQAAEGVRVIAPWVQLGEHVPNTLPNSWAVRQFVATFTPRHGPVGTFAGYGVDAVGMIHVAYTGHRDRGLARTILENLTYVGVTGVFRRAPDAHAGLADDAVTTVVVRGGHWAPEDGQP